MAGERRDVKVVIEVEIGDLWASAEQLAAMSDGEILDLLNEDIGALLNDETAKWTVVRASDESLSQDVVGAVREALEAAHDWIVGLAESGDAGFWDPDEDDNVIRLRHALKLLGKE